MAQGLLGCQPLALGREWPRSFLMTPLGQALSCSNSSRTGSSSGSVSRWDFPTHLLGVFRNLAPFPVLHAGNSGHGRAALLGLLRVTTKPAVPIPLPLGSDGYSGTAVKVGRCWWGLGRR